jgi:adhesin transport system outer membrane protein
VLPQIVRNAAVRASADISIVGHSDTLGTFELNEALSLKHAQAVADWLQSQGAKVDAMTLQAQGKRKLQITTPDARHEPRNRRVEVTVR